MNTTQHKGSKQIRINGSVRKRKRVLQRLILVGLCLFNIMVITGLINLAKTHNADKIETVIPFEPLKSTNDSQVSTKDDLSNANDNQSVTSNIKSTTQWNLILVNGSHKIPDDFNVTLIQLKNDQSVDERIYTDLQEMMNAARADGIYPMITSSYRTSEMQEEILTEKVEEYEAQGFLESKAEEMAKMWVAVPGTSEHQIGLALDIGIDSNQVLDGAQSSEEVHQWLVENCYKYGFILRYPEGKTKLTGVQYEPWHYRYVGKEVAQEITEKGICFEEYIEGLNK